MKEILVDKIEVDKMDDVLKQFPPNIEGIKTAMMLLARYCIEISAKTNATTIKFDVAEIYDKETLKNIGNMGLEWSLTTPTKERGKLCD